MINILHIFNFILFKIEVYRTWWFILFSLIISSFVLLFSFKRVSLINKDVIRNFSELENSKEQYRLYFLFMGIALPLIEFCIEFFELRVQEFAPINLIVSVTLLTIYFSTFFSASIYRKIRELFIVMFSLYFGITIFRIIENPSYVSTYFDFLILLFLAYNIFRSIKYYWLFIACNFIIIGLLFYFNIIDKTFFVIMMYTCFMASLINHVRFVVNLNIKDNFLFADNIVNKGTSLVLAVNKLGEVVYSSQNIQQILGYNTEEVRGMNFWKLTRDEEFTTDNYEINSGLYVRKLLAKDGSYRYIQWKDSKYSEDLYVGIGQDVTEQIDLEHQYKNLIESATDIIYETDRFGNFTFINQYAKKLLGFENSDIIGKNFNRFIREDYREEIQQTYKNYLLSNLEIPSIEFPILIKNGSEIWISQNVTISRDIKGKVKGFSAIARDVTLLKKIQLEQESRQQKTIVFSNIINHLATQPFEANETFEIRIRKIIKAASEGSLIDRISYWTYFPDKLKCISIYDLESDEFDGNFESYKSESPIYFEALENDKIIAASNVFKNPNTIEFIEDYFPENNIKSMLDVPVLFNGELHSILCFETTKNFRDWDHDDINFARSVADIVSIAIEKFKRQETEHKLELKSRILSALALSTIKMLSNRNIQLVLSETFEIIGKATNVDRVYFFKNNAEKKSMSIHTEWINGKISKLSELSDLYDMPNDKNDYFLRYLLENKIFIKTVADIQDDMVRQRLESQGTLTILQLPIFVRDQFYGSIGFDDCTNGRFWTEDEIGILQILANNITSAIERIENENLIFESEQKFKSLANNIPGTVYLSQNNEKFSKLFVSDNIFELTGYTKDEFLTDKIFLIDLVYEEDKKELLIKNRKALNDKTPLHLSYRIVKKNGEIIWVEEFGEAILKEGEINFLEGILFDITEKKQVEAEIKARELAEASNKSKSEFLANMSHEIRTPLNAIIGFSSILNETELDNTQKDYLATVNQSASILLEVVNDILDFSKIETGKLELEYKKTDLYELSNQIIDIIRFDSEQKQIQLELKIDENVPKYVSIDPLRIKQILLNLLSNAVKFTDKGKVELNIEIENKKEDSATFKFFVKDSGIGIKKDNHAKIFEPFSQEDNSTTRKYGGTGLGLAISNNILKLMGSKLELESHYRRGSTFHFSLDLNFCTQQSKCSNQDIIDLDVNYYDISNEILFQNKEVECKVLVVEDNKINMMLARTLIKKLLPKAIVIEAENGLIGIEKFKAHQPDIILMDIQMPVLNGYEASQEIRKIDKNVSIIALTAGTIKGEKEKCLETGMNDYISKPINKDLFENILQKWLPKM